MTLCCDLTTHGTVLWMRALWNPEEVFLPLIYGIPMKCVWDSYKVPMKILRNAYELKMFHWNFFEILMIWSYAAIWPRLAGFCNADMRCDHAWNAIWRYLTGFCDADMRLDHAWDAIWPRLEGFCDTDMRLDHAWDAIWPRLVGFCDADMRFDHAWDAIWPRTVRFCDFDMRFDHAWDAIWPRLGWFCVADIRFDHACGAIWPRLIGVCDSDMRFVHAWRGFVTLTCDLTTPGRVSWAKWSKHSMFLTSRCRNCGRAHTQTLEGHLPAARHEPVRWRFCGYSFDPLLEPLQQIAVREISCNGFKLRIDTIGSQCGFA